MKPAALAVCCALAGCGPGFAARYAAGNHALSSSEGAMYFVVLGPVLQQALNQCIPPGTAGAAPVLVVVADVDAAGAASAVDVEPDSPGTGCLRDQLRERRLPRPPLQQGVEYFPIGLRIDTK
jgi:hypothetical protein